MEKTVETTQTTSSQEDLTLRCQQLEQEVEILNAKLQWFEEHFRLRKAQQHGASREHTPDEQIGLFDEAEKEADPAVPEPTTENINYTRKKQKGRREAMLRDLPVERVEYTLEDTNCPQCDGSLHVMSQEVRKEITVIPAQVKVTEHVRFVYTCRSCEQQEETTPVITAPMPAPILPGSLVSPSFMAFVMNRKYGEGLPLYRQEQQLHHFGLDI